MEADMVTLGDTGEIPEVIEQANEEAKDDVDQNPIESLLQDESDDADQNPIASLLQEESGDVDQNPIESLLQDESIAQSDVTPSVKNGSPEPEAQTEENKDVDEVDNTAENKDSFLQDITEVEANPTISEESPLINTESLLPDLELMDVDKQEKLMVTPSVSEPSVMPTSKTGTFNLGVAGLSFSYNNVKTAHDGTKMVQIHQSQITPDQLQALQNNPNIKVVFRHIPSGRSFTKPPRHLLPPGQSSPPKKRKAYLSSGSLTSTDVGNDDVYNFDEGEDFGQGPVKMQKTLDMRARYSYGMNVKKKGRPRSIPDSTAFATSFMKVSKQQSKPAKVILTDLLTRINNPEAAMHVKLHSSQINAEVLANMELNPNYKIILTSQREEKPMEVKHDTEDIKEEPEEKREEKEDKKEEMPIEAEKKQEELDERKGEKTQEIDPGELDRLEEEREAERREKEAAHVRRLKEEEELMQSVLQTQKSRSGRVRKPSRFSLDIARLTKKKTSGTGGDSSADESEQEVKSPKPVLTPSSASTKTPEPSMSESQKKKKRGRPRKNPPKEVEEEKEHKVTEEEEKVTKENKKEDEPLEENKKENEPLEENKKEDEPSEENKKEDEPSEESKKEDEPSEESKKEDEPSEEHEKEDAPSEENKKEDGLSEEEKKEDEPSEEDKKEDETSKDEKEEVTESSAKVEEETKQKEATESEKEVTSTENEVETEKKEKDIEEKEEKMDITESLDDKPDSTGTGEVVSAEPDTSSDIKDADQDETPADFDNDIEMEDEEETKEVIDNKYRLRKLLEHCSADEINTVLLPEAFESINFGDFLLHKAGQNNNSTGKINFPHVYKQMEDLHSSILTEAVRYNKLVKRANKVGGDKRMEKVVLMPVYNRKAADALELNSTSIDAHICGIHKPVITQMIAANSFFITAKMDSPTIRLKLPEATAPGHARAKAQKRSIYAHHQTQRYASNQQEPDSTTPDQPRPYKRMYGNKSSMTANYTPVSSARQWNSNTFQVRKPTYLEQSKTERRITQSIAQSNYISLSSQDNLLQTLPVDSSTGLMKNSVGSMQVTTGTSALAQLQATIDEHQQSLISTTNVTDPTSLAISTAEGHQIVTVGESLASTAATDTNTAQAEQYLVADGGVPISEIVGSETDISADGEVRKHLVPIGDGQYVELPEGYSLIQTDEGYIIGQPGSTFTQGEDGNVYVTNSDGTTAEISQQVVAEDTNGAAPTMLDEIPQT